MQTSKRGTTIAARRGDEEDTLVIRRARPADSKPLERLAQLDSSLPLDGPLLLAEVAGEIRAARSLATGETIADPFQRTYHLRALLSARAEQNFASGERPTLFTPRFRRLYARAEAR
jgi:hypothetical protein